MDLIINHCAEFMDCFVIVGFDDDGEINAFSHHATQLQEHALRKLIVDVGEGDGGDLLLPSTSAGNVSIIGEEEE